LLTPVEECYTFNIDIATPKMLIQRSFTTHEYITDNKEINWVFEYKNDDEFGYFLIIENGRLDTELRLEKDDLLTKMQKLQTLLPKCWEGWNGDNFNHNHNYMIPEHLAETMYDEENHLPCLN
tara:strand:- start:45 stop:413 length:369 start_codon:yes stop_codon:yes gene_type:complete